MSAAAEATLQIPGAERAIVGMIRRCGQPAVLVYSRPELVRHFMRDGMTREEAEEWIDVNVIGAWVGAGTPAVLEAYDPEALG